MSSSQLRSWVEDDEDRPSIYTYSTVSTNATVDNQPGTGRVLDNVYQSLGRILDKGLAKLMGVLSKKVHTSPAKEEERFDTISTISNETIDNQSGPGRAIDSFVLQPLGRKLEKKLGDTADRLGFGPNAIERKLLRLLGSIWLHNQGVAIPKKNKEMLDSASGAVMKAAS